MQDFACKLKAVKCKLKDWSKVTYGNIFQKTLDAEKNVEDAEIVFTEKNDEASKIHLNYVRANLIKHLAIEDDYWKQKANVRFNLEGDKNTKFFHATVKGRRARSLIHRIKNDKGDWLDREEDINNHIVQFYTKQLNREETEIIPDNCCEVIPHMITTEENAMISAIPDIQEVKNAVWGLNKDSAAGPDGFNGHFYRSCWDIIKNDLHTAIIDFFCGRVYPKSWTSTNIVLIPKTHKPDNCNNLRPISLSNFNQKVISKIMATRLQNVLPKIISTNQTGFVKGRSITDNIMLAQEIIQKIGANSRGGNIALKLDMAKAYDRVSWQYLTKVLRAFGFNEMFIDMVFRTISNCQYSILINGVGNGFFSSNRGLKQGDPLSPALFVIAAETLSMGLQEQMETGKIDHFTQPRGTKIISHLAFADDVIIFSRAGKRNLTNLMRFINHYQQASGQLVNNHKCTFITAKGTENSKKRVIQQITGFKWEEMPIKYLGCPIFSGRNKIQYYQGLVNSIKGKIEGWRCNWLNQAGRLILIKHVLCAIPIHLMAAISPPKAVIKEIDRLLSNFFWGSKGDKFSYHWIAWSRCCKSKKEWGLDIKRFKDIIHVQSLKLYWKLSTEDNQWSNFLKVKYNFDEHNSVIRSNATGLWKRIIRVQNEANSYIVDDGNGPKWSLSTNGDFSTKHTWKKILEGVTGHTIFYYIWDPLIPSRISIFSWKLIQNKLPLDVNLQRLGINLASRCKCCTNHKEENQTHLFVDSEIAIKVWRVFTGKLGIITSNANLGNLLKSWWCRTGRRNRASIFFHVLPQLICWEIWKSRNKAHFEDAVMNSDHIIECVKRDFKICTSSLKNNTEEINSTIEDILR